MPEDKTEEPTRKRVEDAKNKGRVAFSREINNFLIISVLVLVMVLFIPNITSNSREFLKNIILASSDFNFTTNNVNILLKSIILNIFKIIIIPILLFFCSGVISGIIQNGFMVNFDLVSPKLEKISPLQGLKRVFSLRSVIELIINVLKVVMIAFALYLTFIVETNNITAMSSLNFHSIYLIMYQYTLKAFYVILLVVFLITVLDFCYRKYSHHKSLMMTKQEVKDELKQTEISPELKARLRKMRKEIAKKNMMAEVNKADVVITNPTHIAVALWYEPDTMPSPKIVAKGKGYIAEKIKKIAQDNSIPIIENKLLARSLFETVEIDAYIPEQHYKAVAEIISYVYKLKGKVV